MPLIVAHGRDVTTRQIAEASGVAEGTLFRVFDDKDAIIDAAVEEFLDPEPFREALRRIDPSLPLEMKLRLVLDRFQDRFSGIFGVFASLGTKPRPPAAPNIDEIVAIFEHLLAPELDALRVPVADVFAYVRLVAFASALPHFAPTVGLDTQTLAHLIACGIVHESSEPRTAFEPRTASEPRTDRRGLAPC